MAYSDFMATPDYQTKKTGAQLAVVIKNEDDPSDVIIGAVTGCSATDEFEVVPIEEAGNDGVDEIAQGRHTGQLSIQAFFTPAWNDKLPTRENFAGKSYTVLKVIGEDFTPDYYGTVMDAWTGCRISRTASSLQARGANTFDLGMMYERHYNGEQYAAISGT